jgi:uroporphyrinogen decarboxylase
MMPEPTLTDAMTALGLNRYEAAVYVTLVRSPRMTASQIAARSNVPRQRVYDILGELCRQGLVAEQPGKQRCFTPVDPSLALPNLQREYKRQQTIENEERALTIKELVARLRPYYLKANPSNGADTHVRLLPDPALWVAHLNLLADQSEKHIAYFGGDEFPPAEALPALARAAERMPLQGLFPLSALANPETKQTIARLAHAGTEIRLSQEQLFPLAIFDERSILFAEPENAPASVFEVKAETLAHFFSSAFDSYWRQATPYEALAGQGAPVRPIRRAPADARERLLEAMRLGQPDPVPASWLGGGIWTINHRGHTFTSLIGQPQDMASALIETFERTGNPIVFVGSGYNIFQLAPFGAKIQFRVVGHLDLAEPLVRDADDLDAFDVSDLAREPAIQTIWEAARLVAAEIGDETLVAATAWGPFNLAAHIMGIEALTRGLYKNPRQVEKAITFAVRVIKKFYEPLLAEKITPLVSLADTVAGDHVSRAHFEHFVLPYLQDIISWAKGQNALVLLHICGGLQDKLDLLAVTGADCVSLDSRVNLKRAKELFAGRMCVAGNVDPVGVLDHLTAKEVEAASRECLLVGASGGGFILMTGCDIPPTVPLDNVRAMLRAAEMWR